jgi:hypothetical protein
MAESADSLVAFFSIKAGLPKQMNKVHALQTSCGYHQNLQQWYENEVEINHFLRLNSVILKLVGLVQKTVNQRQIHS